MIGRRGGCGRAAALLAAFLACVPCPGLCQAGDLEPSPPVVSLPKQAFGPEDIAVIVNDSDPQSLRVASYYGAKRAIPASHLIHVAFAPGKSKMDPVEFQTLYERVRRQTPADVQAYVLTWPAPYRVGCLSITMAFAVGYDESYCAKGCRLTRPSPYFASDSDRPDTDYGLRPTMALAGRDFDEVRRLIDRGVQSDERRPTGTAYLVETPDTARNVRAGGYPMVTKAFGSVIKVETIKAESLTGRPDVLFYFTGAVDVPGIRTNAFVPGAVADHLTSTGGQLTDSRQMSSLRWLEAGATGSYGTVVEPCNFISKFPDPVTLIGAYVTGSTLIEAYWKSVLMPGQGIFIGEPLARPYGGYAMIKDEKGWMLSTHALRLGGYQLEQAESPIGPFRVVGTLVKASADATEFRLPLPVARYYRLIEAAVQQ
ncbi:TIGR03790 family protein [Thiocystis violacea]|uniref:TIGR03790 family protein n=1 Tax=Thiocystis violacea TaxID=13725 RepID=UPI0019041611|nr:TIGR03790 family protein [Thiocystis violacea]MBK1721197.1 TIGR03790 family protein [Thiocystis violacea]